MNEQQLKAVLRCPSCNQTMEYLNFEKILKPIIKENSDIGLNKTVKCVNLQFYCKECKYTTSKQFPYENPDILLQFIDDIKRQSVAV